MRLLPYWALANRSPAFYDTESGSAIEQTARVYAAMQELIKEYNSFAEEVNNSIVDFKSSLTQNNDDFKCEITNIVHNYIAMLDDKIKKQDMYIDETITYIKNNLIEALKNMLDSMVENGELDETILQVFSNIEVTLGGLVNDISTVKIELAAAKEEISELDDAIRANNIKIENLEEAQAVTDGRIEILENTEYILEHDETTETLTLKKVVPGGA